MAIRQAAGNKVPVSQCDEVGEPIPELVLSRETSAFKRQLEAGCTVEEVANIWAVSEEHLQKQYGGIIREAQAECRNRTRQAIFAAAEKKHDPTALLLLAKMYLGVELEKPVLPAVPASQ